jgi:rRNA maturation endonuclease Nob1
LESIDVIEADSSRIGASLSNAKEDEEEEEEEEEEWPALPSTNKAVAITSSAIDLKIQDSKSSNADISGGDAVKSEENIWAKASALMSERPEEWPTLQASCCVPYDSDDDHDSGNDNNNHDYDYNDGEDEEIDADREGCDEFEDDHCEDDNCVVTAVDIEHDTNFTSAESLLEDMHIHDIENNSTTDSKSVVTDTSTAKVQVKASFSRSSAILRGGASGGWSAAASARAAAEDDGIGWISRDNITSHLSALGNSLGRASVVTDGSEKSKNKNRSKNTGRNGKGMAPEVVDKAKVACMTTDFSMQNVLIQLGLKVLSVDGLLVKSVKQFVLRCMACYQV